MELYLRKHYDFFYVRKEVEELSLLHFVCLKKEENVIKGSIVVMIPFNNFVTFKNMFEINNKEAYDNLKNANTNEQVGREIINIVEKNVNWSEIYDKCKNAPKKSKDIEIEER